MKILAIIAGLVVFIGGGYWVYSALSVPMTASTVSSVSVAADQYATTSVQVNPESSTSSSTSEKKIMNATLHTNKGDITIEFLPQQAPNTTANFIKLAQAGFYDGTKFHRVIKNFMNQGGDPLSKDDAQKNRWGTGGPGYSFADEITAGNSNTAGTIAMANAGPNTNGSQFFINAVDNHSLDTKHTVFGHVVGGMDVVLLINSVPTDSADHPLEPVVIQSITLN